MRAIRALLPHENIVYFGDTARVPYGPKSSQVVREYAAQDTDVLLGHDVKMIVIACNTVSAVALDVVQKRAKVPVVGVIMPGAEAAARATTKKRVGVIGTIGTINSNAYVNALRQFDPAIEAFGAACPLFVPLAEEGWTDHKATELIAKEYLFPLTLEKIDTLILGCTHYPLLKDVVQKVMGPKVQLVDSAREVALEVKDVLSRRRLLRTHLGPCRHLFIVTDEPKQFACLASRFLGGGVRNVRRHIYV